MTFEEILSHYPGPRKPNGQGGVLVPCSLGHGTKTPCLSITPANGAGPRFHCFTCNSDRKEIIEAAGLTLADIYDAPPRKPSPAAASRTSAPITISDLGKDKRLPVDFLQRLGLEDRHDFRQEGRADLRGVLIPYRMMDESPAPRQRARTALSAKAGSVWLPGDGSPVPYGLDRIMDGREEGFLVLVEGESDCWTVWYHGFPALGIPGATMEKTLLPEYLLGIREIYLWREPDKGGATFAEKIPARLREIGYTGGIFEAKLDGVKDPNELHKKNPEDFKATFQAALDSARTAATGTETATTPVVATDPAPAEVADLERFPLSDAGNAELLAERFGRDLRRDHAQKRWLYFGGHRWTPDNDGAPVRLALDTTRARFHGATAAKGDREKIAKWALKSESRERIAAALSIAEALPPIADRGTGWDEAPFLLGGPNGVWDLRTGEVRPGRREDRITMTTGTNCNPAARAPRFRTFLGEVFQENAALIDFIQRAVGYTACGAMSEEVFFLLHGTGANGKSKFLSALRAALGDYAGETSFLTFEAAKRKSGEATPDLAELPGKRLVTASEGTDGVRWDERRVKVLTGRDPIKARDLYKSNVTFTPACVFWLSSNHKPEVGDETESFWRRILLIPFSRFFGPGDRDPNLEEKLLSEKEGILAWIVEGALAWQRTGLDPPAVVRAATAEYRREEDPLADFIEDRCILAPHLITPTGDLFVEHEAWVKDNGETPLKQKEFGQRLTARGIKVGRKGGKRVRFGIALKVVTRDAS